MENYIVINGKKAELTKEQLEKLGIKPKRNNPFDRVKYKENYFSIGFNGDIYKENESFGILDNKRYAELTYCNDEEFAKQMYLKSLLNRKLEKYAWDNKAEDVEWNAIYDHYYICYDYYKDSLAVSYTKACKECGMVHFSNKDTANEAIENVVLPFMKKYSEFKW